MLEYKVVFHIDEMSRWQVLLANVSNLLNAIENRKFDIEVLANAEAVNYYDPSKKLNMDLVTLGALSEKGVTFAACNNALKGNNVALENLPEFVKVVHAGVVELIEKQSEGYAYIRP